MKIALFVDFDNVYSGLRRISGEAAERFSRQPLNWLHWLTRGYSADSLPDLTASPRRILVRRCYLNPVMYQKYRRPFHEAGFEIVDCPPMTATGKTSTDIHLVLDTMDALSDATHFDEFIVFSADADFSPLLRRLRRHDRRTVVFAAGAMSESYKASVDRVLDIQTFLSDALHLHPGDDAADTLETTFSMSASKPVEDVRARVAEYVRRELRAAPAPFKLPALAQRLHREFSGLKESQWDGAGSFGALMRQLGLLDVKFDFESDTAILLASAEAKSRPSTQHPPGDGAGEASTRESASCEASELSPDFTRVAAANVVRRVVAASPVPVHLGGLGQLLRQHFPQLRPGWNGATNLAAFLQQLPIEPLQRAVLENGTTVVLYDPTRHSAPIGIVGDKLVAAMLRAAELPEMRGADFVQILRAARHYMGGTDNFEIAEISRDVAATLADDGLRISPRRVASVLQALIFGGLETGREYETTSDLTVASTGVILAAWARETQSDTDDDSRNRLLCWLEGSPNPA